MGLIYFKSKENIFLHFLLKIIRLIFKKLRFYLEDLNKKIFDKFWIWTDYSFNFKVEAI